MPIYYGSRISKFALNAAELPKLDAEFAEITEGEEMRKKEEGEPSGMGCRETDGAKRSPQGAGVNGDGCINRDTMWAAMEARVGDPKRIALVAADLVAHIERKRTPNPMFSGSGRVW